MLSTTYACTLLTHDSETGEPAFGSMAECEEALPHLPIVSACDAIQRDFEFMEMQVTDPAHLRYSADDTPSWMLLDPLAQGQDSYNFVRSCAVCHQPSAAHYVSIHNTMPQEPWNILNDSGTDRFRLPPTTKDEDEVDTYFLNYHHSVTEYPLNFSYSRNLGLGFHERQLLRSEAEAIPDLENIACLKDIGYSRAIAGLETVDATVNESNSGHPRLAASVGVAALASFSRRGRGQRKNKAYWKTVVEHGELQNPFERDCLFGSEDGPLTTPATSCMDSTSAIPRCMSMKYLHELGLESHLSAAFEDPGLLSIGMGGQKAKVTGIVRDIAFRLKGASNTFRGDFYVSELLDGFYDILFGWQFMSNEAADILEKAHKVYQDAKAFIGNAASKLTVKIGNVVSQTQRRVSDFVSGVSLPPPPYSLVNILEGDYVVAPRVL